MSEKNDTYNESYYLHYCATGSYMDESTWGPFFQRIAGKIVETYHPQTVLDVGCALGYLVAALRDLGVEAYGVDVSKYAVSQVRDDIKPYCFVADMVQGPPEALPTQFDLVTCIEVAEHIYEEDMSKFMENLCSLSPTVIFTSTPEDIMDRTHFNVQQPEYWAKQFAARGFYRNLLVDMEIITPHAMVFEKKAPTQVRLVEDYERSIRQSSYKTREYKNEAVEKNIELSDALEKKYLAEVELARVKHQASSELSDELACVKHQEAIKLNDALEKKQLAEDELAYSKYQLKIKEKNCKEWEEKFSRQRNDFDVLLKEKVNLEENWWYLKGERERLIAENEALAIDIAGIEHAYQAIIHSSSWKVTRPWRVLKRGLKKLFSSGNTPQPHPALVQQEETLPDPLPNEEPPVAITAGPLPVNAVTANAYLNQHFRNLQPINTFISPENTRRLNLVTDSLAADSLLGGVSTALILATLYANAQGIPLRIITRNCDSNPLDYENILRLNNIPLEIQVSFYSDYNRDGEGYCANKLDISEEDIFLATSWWSAAAIRKTTLRPRFFYIIQEVETFFYPHGDNHLLCSQILQDPDIDFIVNSNYLWEYFSVHFPNVVKNGTFFEPAFSAGLYHPQQARKKEKYTLFFYARPNNPRNLFYYGLGLLDRAIRRGILAPAEWRICCAGQQVPDIVLGEDTELENLGLMDWEEYGEFLGEVDMALSLMYTPHPSYPPFDVAMSGGVVLSNKCLNKQEFLYCENVLLADLDEESFMETFEQAVVLAKDPARRKANYEKMKINQSWPLALEETLAHMRRTGI